MPMTDHSTPGSDAPVKERPISLSAKKSPSASIYKPIGTLRTPTKSLCSGIGGDETPRKSASKQQPMAMGPPRFAYASIMNSPQFGRVSHVPESIQMKEKKQITNTKVVVGKSATGRKIIPSDNKSQASMVSRYSTPKVGSSDFRRKMGTGFLRPRCIQDWILRNRGYRSLGRS